MGSRYTSEYYNTNGVVVVARPPSLENIFPPKHFVKVVDPLTFARILPLPPSKKHTDSSSQWNTPNTNLSLSSFLSPTLSVSPSLSLSLYIYLYLFIPLTIASEAAMLVYIGVYACVCHKR